MGLASSRKKSIRPEYDIRRKQPSNDSNDLVERG